MVLSDKVEASESLYRVVKRSRPDCIAENGGVSPAPSDINPYHANIFLDSNEKKRNLQALKLADNSKIVYNDGSMQWVVIPK